MPKSYKKKPLGSWPDDKKHKATRTPQGEGETSVSGHMPDPEEIEDKDALEVAQEAGLYSDQDEEHPGELGLGEEEEKDIQNK